MKKSDLENAVEQSHVRSAWGKGVKVYALELLGTLEAETINNVVELKTDLLNGADTWEQYSSGGCALIYDGDIAERLCTPSELKRTRNGDKQPNNCETWIDVQTRALRQAWFLIRKCYIKIGEDEIT